MDLQYVQGTPIFTKINKVHKQYEYITEDIKTEVIIIGGGVTGSILGYYFTKANIPSVILEKTRIGYGSTSITTSLLQYELDGNAKELEQYTSLNNVIQSYKLGLKALDEIDKFIQEHGNRCDYEIKDTLLYSSNKLDIDLMNEEYLIRKKAGLDVAFISEENTPFSFELKAGVYANRGGAQLDPYKYTHQLLDVSVAKGLKVYENSEAITINYLQDEVEVITNFGYKVRGKKVIIATGYNTDRFTKRNFGVKTLTYNIATKSVDDLHEWYNKVLIRDNESPYNYFRTTNDNRIIAGGEDIPFNTGIFDETIAEKKYMLLEQRLKTMFPNIKDLEIEYKYCGAFASTKDNLGFLGPDPSHKNLWYCLGYGANGILFSTLGGLMLSNLYRGAENADLHLFRVDRFDK